MWNLQYGDSEWEVEARKRRGLPPPKWAEEKPTVPPYLNWFWTAYWELDTCRSWTYGHPRAIPWTAIKQYADHHKFDFDYLFDIIYRMDDAYLKYRADQYEKEIEEQRRKAKAGKKR